MPVNQTVLTSIMKKKVAANMQRLTGYSPLGTRAEPYFTMLINAISAGIAQGAPSLTFTTNDVGFTGMPVIPGAGQGVGIDVDAAHMSERMYSYLRSTIVTKFGGTTHEAWPPTKGNSGEYLKAITDGVSEAIKEHFKTCWILTSAHPIVYAGSGVIDPTKAPDNPSRNYFRGIEVAPIKSLILISGGKLLRGRFFPDLAEGIARGYKESMEARAKSSVTIVGVCVPRTTPPQVCNIPAVGKGTGVAS